MALIAEFAKPFFLLLSLLGYYFVFAWHSFPRWHLRPSRALSAIVLFLYACAVVGALRFGSLAVFYVGLAMLCYGIWITVKWPKALCRFWLSPNVILYVLFYAALWYQFRLKWYAHWDEFAHWGLAVKEYLYHDGIVPSHSSLLGKHYPPGVTLFDVFGAHVLGYTEGNMVFVQGLLTLSPLWMLLPNSGWKNIPALVAKLVLLWSAYAFINLLLPGGWLQHIYIDILMGVFFAAALLEYLLPTGRRRSFPFLLAAIAVLPVMKQVGLVLALLAVGIIAAIHAWRIAMVARRRRCTSGVARAFFLVPRAQVLKLLAKVALLAVLPVLLYFTWAKLMPEKSSQLATTPLHQKLLSSYKNPTAEERGIYEAFKNAWLNRKILQVPGDRGLELLQTQYASMRKHDVSPWRAFVVIVSITAFSALFLKARHRWLFTLFLLTLSAFAFNLFYLAVYMFVFPKHEARGVWGYERYIGTYLIGVSLLLLGTFSVLLHSSSRWRRLVAPVLLLLVAAASFLAMPKEGFALLKPGPGPTTASWRQQYKTKAECILKHVSDQTPVYIIFQNNAGLLFRIAKYEISPAPTNEWENPKHSWSLGEPYSPGDIHTQNWSVQEFSEVLSKHYSFLFLAKADDKFWNKYGQLFPDPDSRKHYLFTIDKSTTPVVTALPVPDCM